MSQAQPAVDDYLSQREAFIERERSLRRDYARRWSTSSAAEVQADKTIRNIRFAEANSIWSSTNETLPHMFPGMEFLTARDVITETKLFNIITKMPKGALLHAHLDAMVNVQVLLKLALDQPAIHVRAPQRLTAETIDCSPPELLPLVSSEISSITSSSLTDVSYSPNEWVALRRARDNFDPSLGGLEGFDRWITNALTINPSEAYHTHKTTEKIWKKFGSIFLVAARIIRFAPIWYLYIKEFFRSSVEDGISYVEPRINFVYKLMYNAEGEEVLPHRDWLVIFERALQDVNEELKAQGREDEFIGARVIYSTVRFVTPDELIWYLEDCIALKQEFPHLIAGFDLVGHEDTLFPLINYIKPLLWFRQRQEALGLDIPFIFHAGETLGDGTPADVNLFDAILLGTKRIGHGFSLSKHPELMRLCKERGIAVEMCPISNEILRLTSSMQMHPLPAILNHGIPVVLCSDDPAIFGNMGLSFDFFQVLVASEVTGLITLGQMARDSLEYSSLDVEEKKRAIAVWERRWYKFCEEVVSTESA